MRTVKFINKYPSTRMPWLEFGSSQAEYDKWGTHTCGICCLKMIGDTLGLTTNETIYSLTMGCYATGGFKVAESGGISGVFHYPLLDYARTLGLEGRVEKDLGVDAIKAALAKGWFVLLSIDLAKATTNHKGGHLILIHSYDEGRDVFIAHDCAHAVAINGENAALPVKKVEEYSNKKGLTLFQKIT